MAKFIKILTFIVISNYIISVDSIAEITTDVVGSSVCNVYSCLLTGNIQIVIGAIAILFLGIGLFFGKVNWGIAITIVIGIVLMVSALDIAHSFVPTGDCSSSSDCN